MLFEVRAVRSFRLAHLIKVLALSSGVAAVCFVVALMLGSQPLSLAALSDIESTDHSIFFDVRLPHVLLAAIVGMALGVSGSTLQALMRNPLADPFVLGVSGGAALGATVTIALGLSFSFAGFSADALGAMAGALIALFFVTSLGYLAGGYSPHTLLLAGVAFNSFALAAIAFIKVLSAPDQLGQVLVWLAGVLRPQEYAVVGWTGAGVLLSSLALVMLSPRLNLLAMGDDDAQTMGIHVAKTRRVILIITSICVALAVSVSGLVGFVGLMVPHMARRFGGGDQRLIVPTSALLGAGLLVTADLLARLALPALHMEPPVGLVTALIGVPAFLALMVQRAR